MVNFKNLLMISLLSVNVFANEGLNIYIDPELQNDFSSNSATVTSVSEILANKNKPKEDLYYDKFNKLLNKYCKQEIEIFCSTNSNDNLSCLKNNFELITGNCLTVLKKELGKGVSNNRLSIHDLKLHSKTKFFGSKDKIFYKDAQYKSEHVFSYRDLVFKSGFFTARSYPYKEYNGQYVLSSALPRDIFKDNSGIEYNPFWQKGPFFFDEKGNVKIGTLAKTIEYKKHIYLKKGTLVVFDDERNLIKGTIAKSVRIGKCGFLANMEISDKKIKECK